MNSQILKKNSETLNKLSSGITLEKRFENEFDKLEKIGRGGFASVYKVRNILDNSLYAIKKIKIKIDSKNKELQKEISTVLQEIRLLAKFKSEHIVTYNHSWMEVNLKKEKSILNRDESNEEAAINKQFSYEIKEETVSYDMEMDFSNVKFEDEGTTFQWDDDIEEQKEEENFIIIGREKFLFNEIESISIFIQMSLCDQTLSDWLEHRNKKFSSKSSRKKNLNNSPSLNFSDNNHKEFLKSLKIFESILLGVEYIHLKENLIHRDLKPSNIFFSGEKIKIGDLGLATDSLNKKYDMMCPSPILERSLYDIDADDHSDYSDELGLDSSFKLEIEENTSYRKELSDNYNILVEHTSNIGTSQYAAPEQLNNNFYDNKVDIFSLGLILLELVYPYKTLMEKHELKRKLTNQRELPPCIPKKLQKLILDMTEHDPSKRLNIIQTLEEFENILEDFSFSLDSKSFERKLSSYLEKTKRKESLNLKTDHESCHCELKNLLSEKFINIKLSNEILPHTPTNRSTSINSLSDRQSKTTEQFEKRKRFLSEDISSIQSFKFFMKNEAEWTQM
jgi:serine/threonine protein kinase